MCYRNFQYVRGVHAVSNEMKWSVFYAPPCIFCMSFAQWEKITRRHKRLKIVKKCFSFRRQLRSIMCDLIHTKKCKLWVVRLVLAYSFSTDTFAPTHCVLKNVLFLCCLTAVGLWDLGCTTQNVHGPVQRIYTRRIDGPRLFQGCHGSHHKGDTSCF